jgi:hypothetical protein
MSCEKEVLKPQVSKVESLSDEISNENLLESNSQTRLKKGYGDKACTIYDNEGHGTIAGTRCASPNGGDCKTKTECAGVAVIDDSYLPEGMSAERFIEMWNSEEGKPFLESKGFYALDDVKR